METSSDGTADPASSSNSRWSRLDTVLHIAPGLFLYLALSGLGGRLGLGRLVLQVSLGLGAVLGVISGAAFLGLLLRAPRSFRLWLTGLAWIGAVVLTLGAGAMGGLEFLLSRSDVCRGRSRTDGEYALLYSGFMQGREVELAEVLADNPLFRAYRIVAIHSDPPHPAALVVRPAAEDLGDDWQIHGAPDGLVAGFHDGMRCVVAFDLSKGRSWGSSSTQGSPDCVTTLPPFRLLGPSGTPLTADIARLEEIATRERGILAQDRRLPPAIDEQSLLDALASPNRSIRDAAGRIIGAGGPEVYPEGTKAMK